MTYFQLVKRLEESGIEDAKSDALILLEEFCNIKKSDILTDRNKDYFSDKLENAVVRRCKREPLQYILGYWYFYGYRFELNEETLCPRSDTEITAQTAANLLKNGITFADIGTGSGCIALSVLKERSDLSAVCIDISEKALEAAAQNAINLGVADRVRFIKADIKLNDFKEKLIGIDAIVSNPPYIPTGEIASLQPEVKKEPYRALDGGSDGLDFYKKITSDANACGIDTIIYEAGFGEADAIATDGSGYGYKCRRFTDLSGIERTVVLEKN